MDWIPIDWISINLLVIVEDDIAPERTRPDDVTICEDVTEPIRSAYFQAIFRQMEKNISIPSLSINHKTSSLRRQGGIRIKRTSLAKSDGDNIADHILYGCLPLGGIRSDGQKRLWRGLLQYVVFIAHFHVVFLDVRGVVASRLLAIDRGTVVF